MNDSALFDKIMATLRTTVECSQVIACLAEFAATSFSSTTSPQREQIFRKIPTQIAPLLNDMLSKASYTAEEQIVVKRQINDLLDKLRTYKSIKLTIAFRPNDETIAFFSDWIKKNVKIDLLVDLQFDKSIVGGAQIIAGGVYKDYSVKKKLADRFQIQKEEILSLLD